MPYEKPGKDGSGRKTQPCIVCDSPANVDHSIEEDTVDCSRCGDFQILRRERDDFLPLKDLKHRALASYLIQKLQDHTRPILTPDFFKSLSQRSLPTPAEASDNLLLLMAGIADGSPGKELNIYAEPQILGLIGVISRDDIAWTFRALQSAN